MPTEIELVLEQTQQDTSHEVSISTEGVEELKRKVKIKGEKKKALLTRRTSECYLKSVHSDDGNPSRVDIKQALWLEIGESFVAAATRQSRSVLARGAIDKLVVALEETDEGVADLRTCYRQDNHEMYVPDALLDYEANQNSRNENRNRNGNRNGNGNDNRNGIHDSGSGNKRTLHTARGYTYKEFLNCQLLNFKGTKGAKGLAHWFKKMESVFHISNCVVECQMKYATFTLLGGGLTWWNSYVMIVEHDVAYEMLWYCLKKMMTEAYCQRKEIQKLENEMWNLTMKGIDLLDKPIDNHAQQPPYKRQNVARAYTAGSNEKKEIKNRGNATGISNHGNAAGSTEARGRFYALGSREANPNFNVVTEVNERPPMLKKGNHITWESRPMIPNPDKPTERILKPLSKITEGNKKKYIANVRVMNYLIQAIPNDIYSLVDACKNAKDMWKRIKRLMFGSDVTNHKPRVRDAKYFREQMLLAMKDEARSNLKDEENDFMLNNSYGDETLEELTVAVIMMARIQSDDDNTASEPNYDEKAVSEVNASTRVHEQVNRVQSKTIIYTSDDDQIGCNIIFLSLCGK
nr:reverse transcriptase domain-containing protein [Tanacetum cinerariifolium]